MTSRKTFAAAGVAALLCLGPGLAAAHGPGFGGSESTPPYGMHYGWHPGWHQDQQMGPGMMMPGCPMGPGQGMGGHGMMMGPGMMGPGYGPGGGYGSPMMGPGMRGQGMDPGMGPGMGMGQGMGPGMGSGMGSPGMGMGMGMGMGQGMGPGMMQQAPQSISADDVRDMLERRLAWQGNPNVKLGKVEEKDADTILAEIVTQDGSLVERLEIDRRSGWMRMVR